MAKIGIVAFSFALRDRHQEPNPCNIRLGKATERVFDWVLEDDDEPVLVVQWEVGLALEESDTNNRETYLKRVVPHLIVERHRTPDTYLDSEEVMAQAAIFFRERGITHVVPIAQTFLQIIKCRQLVKDAGFKVWDMSHVIGKVGFDPESKQWWTRGPIRLLWYAVRQKLFGYHG